MMKMTKFLVCFCVAALSNAASAQESPVPKPTAEHEILATEEGAWDAKIKTYQNGPDSEPLVSKGVEINTVVTGDSGSPRPSRAISAG